MNGSRACRGRVRLRQPVPAGVRPGDDGAERGALQRGLVLRRLLRDPVQQQHILRPRRRTPGEGDGDEPVPGELLQARRELVQPTEAALRPVQAHVPVPRHGLPRRHHPRPLPPRAVRQQGRRRPVPDDGERVVVFNVAGAGEVDAMEVKGSTYGQWMWT
jgi:hypothetical protein